MITPCGRLTGFGESLPPFWTPRQVSNVLHYWAVNEMALSDGTAVPSITDVVSGFTLSQATSSKQPLYRTNAGKPSLKFDDVAGKFLSGTLPATINSPYTWGCIVRPSANSQTQGIVDYNSFVVSLFAGDTAISENNNGSFLAQTTATDVWYVLTAVFNGSSSVFRINGTDLSGTVGTARLSSGGTLYFGSRAGLVYFSRADISDVWIAPGVISSTDRDAWEAYAAQWTT